MGVTATTSSASTYTPIATYIVSGTSTSTYTFSSIPSTYTDLILVINYSLNAGGTGGAVHLQFNGDTASNYSNTFMYGSGSSAVSSRATAQTYVDAGYMSSNAVSANSISHIMNYSNATTYKTVLSRANNTSGEITAYVNLWRSTAAINSITVSAVTNYSSGTTFTLYGIKAA